LSLANAEYAWRRHRQTPSEDDSDSIPSRLPDVSPKAQAAKLERWSRVSQALQAIPVARLSPEVRIDYLVYRAQIDALLAQQHFREYEKPLNADSSFWGEVAQAARESFRTEQDYRHYLATLRDIPRYFDQQIQNMRAGLARGFTPPRIT